ncbi:MAG: hypothetical protein AB7G13_14875 [Lautropia sp.]
MAKPNYAFAKRQRELAKKQKLEEKRLRKAAGAPVGDAPAHEGAEGAPAEPGVATGSDPAGVAPGPQGTIANRQD